MRKKFLWFQFVILFMSANFAFASAIELTFYIPGSATAETTRMYIHFIKEFNLENQDINISVEAKDSYNGVLNQVLDISNKRHGKWVAIIEISELFTLKDTGAIASLEELMKSESGGRGAFLKQFIPGFLGNCKTDDGLFYGLPVFRSTPIIYYNLDILKEAGVNINNLPKTWDELETALEKVKTSTNMAPFGLAGVWYCWLFEAFVRQNGGALSNETYTQVFFNRPETIETLKFWKRLKDKGLLLRVRDWKATLNSFVYRKNFAVIYYSTGGMRYVQEKAKFNWATDIMPKKKIYATPVGGGNVFISSRMSSNEKKAAWKLIKYLLKPSVQATICHNTGYFPVVQAAFEHTLIEKRYATNKNFKNAREQLKFANPKIMTRNFVEIRKILKKAIDATLDYNVPAEQSLAIAQKEAQKWLRKQ